MKNKFKTGQEKQKGCFQQTNIIRNFQKDTRNRNQLTENLAEWKNLKPLLETALEQLPKERNSGAIHLSKTANSPTPGGAPAAASCTVWAQMRGTVQFSK